VDPERFGESARDASDLADRLGDLDLQTWSWFARARVASSRSDHEEGFAWVRRCLDVVPQLTDPDHISLIYFFAVDWAVATGRLEEARHLAEAHDEVTNNLSTHHRLHAVAALITVEEAAGQWEAIRQLTSRAESAVAANVATPCALNVWSLLACARAHVLLGDEQEAQRLERSADSLGMEGYEQLFDPVRIEIAVGRADLAEVERKLGGWRPQGPRDVEGLVAQLNALVALGRGARIEEEAPPLLRPGTYVEPFALRALGFARKEDGLVEHAITRFESMGLDWYAAETRKLLTRE